MDDLPPSGFEYLRDAIERVRRYRQGEDFISPLSREEHAARRWFPGFEKVYGWEPPRPTDEERAELQRRHDVIEEQRNQAFAWMREQWVLGALSSFWQFDASSELEILSNAVWRDGKNAKKARETGKVPYATVDPEYGRIGDSRVLVLIQIEALEALLSGAVIETRTCRGLTDDDEAPDVEDQISKHLKATVKPKIRHDKHDKWEALKPVTRRQYMELAQEAQRLAERTDVKVLGLQRRKEKIAELIEANHKGGGATSRGFAQGNVLRRLNDYFEDWAG